MPPKSSTLSAKAAPNPSRPTNTPKNSNSSIATSGKPSKSTYDQEQDQYRREIEKLQTGLSEVRLKIGDPKDGGDHAPLIARRRALREEMDSLRDAQGQEKSTRGKITDQIRAANESLQRKIKELNASRSKLPYKSPAEVDVKIKQLESQIESGTMRIVEEKKALAEIQNLKKSKKVVEAFGPQQDLIENEKSKIDELRKQIDDPSSKSTSDRWGKIKAELDQINAKMDETSKSRDKLFDERRKIQDEIAQLHDKKRESSLRHREANEKFYAKIQEDQQRRINRQKAERDAQEKAEVEQAHVEMREQAALPAYGREIEDCRTLILYFDKLTGSAASTTIEENLNGNQDSKPSSTLPKPKDLRQVDGQDGFEGMVAIQKKGTKEEEFFMGGGKKNNKKNKKATANEAASSNQPLNLPLATINALYALAVPVPMTREEVVNTIATLSEKRKWFAENQQRVTKARIAETEAKIAAAQAKIKTQVPGSTNNNPTESDLPVVELESESPNSRPTDKNDQAESS